MITIAQKPFYTKIKKETVHQSLIEINPNYDSLPEEKQKYLIQLWLKSYEYGLRVVKKDSFTNNKLVTCQELRKRYNEYPDVKNSKLDFLKRLGEMDDKTADLVLQEDANQSDFVYDTYESNYIDKSLDVLNTSVKPKGFEEIDLSLVSQDGFAEGAMQKIDYLAKDALSQMAATMIKDM